MNSTQFHYNPFEELFGQLNQLNTKVDALGRATPSPASASSQERILKSREEAKAIYRISDPTLNRRVREGKITKIYMGRRVLYDLTDLLLVK